jgi:hypothetical protein
VPFLTVNDGDPHNVHVHWHCHVPPARFHEFETSGWDWIKQTAGVCTANAIHISGPKSSGYLNKGARERDAKLCAKGHTARPQGLVVDRQRTPKDYRVEDEDGFHPGRSPGLYSGLHSDSATCRDSVSQPSG